MKIDINFEDIQKLDKKTYDIIDIRSKSSFDFGHIEGAKNIPSVNLKAENLKDKTYFLCCRTGKLSHKVCEKLQKEGANVKSINGGYMLWLKNNLSENANEKSNAMIALKAEESIRKKFHRELLTKFCKAINDYELISPNDKIAVCISGGKDSFLMAKLFQELKKHNKIPFQLVFLVMDPGYNKENRALIEHNAKILNIPIEIFETDIFENVVHINSSPCYICARMRRGHLYNKAKSLGCNKIALGHHYDDVIETILMGMLYGAQIQTMMPKLHSNNFEGMELIRPMYLIREKDILRFRDYNNLKFLQCACKFTEESSKENNLQHSKRAVIKNLIKELTEKLSNKEHQIDGNIFRSVENINLNTIISYKDKNGKTVSFLDEYDTICGE